jgi:hypothetical protein
MAGGVVRAGSLLAEGFLLFNYAHGQDSDVIFLKILFGFFPIHLVKQHFQANHSSTKRFYCKLTEYKSAT